MSESHAEEHERRIAAARAELEVLEKALADAKERAATAKSTRARTAAGATDKQLRSLREEDELAAERLALATRARDAAKTKLGNLEHDLRFAIDADVETKIAGLLNQMRVHVRAARALRLKAAAIDAGQIGPLWDAYVELAGNAGEVVDPRIEAEPNRPRDLIDLYEETARLDGIEVPTRFERTALGAIAAPADHRREVWANADLAQARSARAPMSADEEKTQPPRRSGWQAQPPSPREEESPQFKWADITPEAEEAR